MEMNKSARFMRLVLKNGSEDHYIQIVWEGGFLNRTLGKSLWRKALFGVTMPPMLLRLRKILFYILLLLYVSATPYLILYGLGYVFKPDEREILKTGLVSVTSEPKGATIYIEGRKFSHKTPAIVRGLLPGTYQVRVVRRGFDAWSKKIQVIPEKATRLEPVVLLPQRPERESLTANSYRNLFFKSGEFKISALAKDSRFEDLRKVDLLFKKEAPLHQGKELSGLEGVQIVYWMTKKNSSAVLFKIKREGKTGCLFYDLDHEKVLGDLTGRVPDNADIVDWDAKKPKAVYFLKNQQISGFNLATRQLFSVGENDTVGFGIQRKKIYFIKKDFSFWQASLNGEEVIPFDKRDDNGARIFSGFRAKSYQIELIKRELFQKELLMFRSDQGALLSNNPPYHLIDGGVRGFSHSESGDSEKILYWTKNEIGLFDFAFGSEEEEILPPRMVLYRSGSDIQQVFWAYDNTHILFRDRNEVFLLEAGDQSPYVIRSLQTVARGTDILYYDAQKTLYYLDLETKRIMKRKINE